MLRLIIWWFVLQLAFPSLSASSPLVPELIPATSQDRPNPVWVDRDLAVRDGSIRSDLFTPTAANDIEYLLQTAGSVPEGVEGNAEEIARQSKCDPYWVTVTRPRPDDSFPALLARSELAFAGVVRDQRYGFLLGRPASLLSVEVTDVFTSDPQLGPLETILVRFGTAKLVVGDKLLCHRSLRYPDEPVVGGRILVFGRTIVSHDPPVVVANDSSVFFETERGTVSLPRGAKLLDPPSWSFVVERLREIDPGASAANGNGGR